MVLDNVLKVTVIIKIDLNEAANLIICHKIKSIDMRFFHKFNLDLYKFSNFQCLVLFGYTRHDALNFYQITFPTALY